MNFLNPHAILVYFVYSSVTAKGQRPQTGDKSPGRGATLVDIGLPASMGGCASFPFLCVVWLQLFAIHILVPVEVLRGSAGHASIGAQYSIRGDT